MDTRLIPCGSDKVDSVNQPSPFSINNLQHIADYGKAHAVTTDPLDQGGTPHLEDRRAIPMGPIPPGCGAGMEPDGEVSFVWVKKPSEWGGLCAAEIGGRLVLGWCTASPNAANVRASLVAQAQR